MVSRPGKYSGDLLELLRAKKLTVILLLVVSVFFVIITYYEGWTSLLIIKSLAFLFVLSYIIQYILLIKNNYGFYLVRVFFIVLIFFEIFAGIANSYKESSTRVRGDFGLQDPILGWKLKPNINSEKSIQIFRGDTISIGTYSSDNFSRRIANAAHSNNNSDKRPESENNKSKHAIFLGCSFTFGSGLPYESTFPHIFEKLNPDYKSYNYGYKAYAPHQISLLFNDGINTINNESISEPHGFALYTYIDAHLDRVYGLSIGTPDIFVKDDSLLVKQKSFAKKLAMIYVNNSNTLEYFNIYYTHPQTESYYKRFADIINYTARKYWDLKKNGKFYVGIYPRVQSINTIWVKYLDPDITVLNIQPPDDFQSNYENYVIHPVADGHPNEVLNTYYIEQVIKLTNTEQSRKWIQ